MSAPTSTPAPKFLATMPRGDGNENPPDLGIFALRREDLRTHDGNLFEQGLWAVAVHRFGNWRMGIPLNRCGSRSLCCIVPRLNL
jgi:hypothetical protein